MSQLDLTKIDEWRTAFDEDKQLKLAQLLLHKADPWVSLTTQTALIDNQFVFDIQLKGINDKPGSHSTPMSDQRSTGTCWVYAPLNFIRYHMASKLNVTKLQLSAPYLIFYDKLEKANFYLTTMIEHAKQPLDEHVARYLDASPLFEGGQHNTAADLIVKYGCLPLSVFPVSWSAADTDRMNSLINYKLRENAIELDRMVKQHATDEQVETRKSEMLATVHNVLCICLGTPPKPDDHCTWEYTDKDNKACRWTFTPKTFYRDFTGEDRVEDFVSLVNDPRHEYGSMLEVEHKTTVVGGRPVAYLNAPIDILEQAVIACIKADVPVLFGADDQAGRMKSKGIWDSKAHDTELAFGIKLSMSKVDKIRKGELCLRHSLLITAVHLEEDKPVRYKIENSWGSAVGVDGWFMCTADWFRENGLQIVVPKRFIPDDYQVKLEQAETVRLPVWDVMF